VRRATALALAGGLLLGCGPSLEGQPERGPVRDWSFVTGADDVVFETPGGRSFRWVTAAPLVVEGRLHLVVSTVFGWEDPALAEVLADGRLRMRAAGRLYELRVRELRGPAEIDPLLPTLVRERLHMHATGLRLERDSQRYPGTQIRRWFLRAESDALAR
jgi:hypothetical protein